MSKETSTIARTSWMGWMLALVAVLGVYLLGVPPLVCCLGPSLPGKRGNPHALCADWVTWVAAPWDWLQGNTFLRDPMLAYELWWLDGAGVE